MIDTILGPIFMFVGIHLILFGILSNIYFKDEIILTVGLVLTGISLMSIYFDIWV